MRRSAALRIAFPAALLFGSMWAAAAAGTTQFSPNSGVRVTVNQALVVFNGQPPIERGGRVLVPLRGVLERMGAFVRYNSRRRTVTALRGATNITLPIGSRRALIGSRPVILETPARIVNSSVLVPLRFVAEALGAQVAYDADIRTVIIATPDGSDREPSTVPPRPSSARALTGIVVAVYPDTVPRRIVVMTSGRSGSDEREQTIPLRPNALVSVRRANTPLAITLEGVRPGDTVEIQQTREGVATAIDVIARGSGGSSPVPDSVGTPPPVTRPTNPPDTDSTDDIFKGEFLEANRVRSGAWILKMTDGRLIEVPGSVLVLFEGQKVGVADLRSGDQLTISVDPKTRRGTRVVVTVPQ